MSEPREEEVEERDEHEHGVRRVVSGFGQKVIGGIEEVGGILTGDPITAAEGEFNIEVGEVREDIEEDLEESSHREDDEARREE